MKITDISQVIPISCISPFVTLPFGFEGNRRKNTALSGIEELKKYVEKVAVFDNEKLTQNLPINKKAKEMFDMINEKIYADMQMILFQNTNI